ncbi:hypothetical protein D3C80_1981320 [compost metagenome]
MSGVNIGSSTTNQDRESDIGADSQNMLLHLEGGTAPALDDDEDAQSSSSAAKDGDFVVYYESAKPSTSFFSLTNSSAIRMPDDQV